MTWLDWAIVIVLVVSVLGGLSQGLFRSVCSLCGLIFGLMLAAWNYARIAALLLPIVRIETVADAIGFLLIALLVMAVANVIGAIISKTLHRMGLGCLDRLAGAVFGFLQGALLITLGILVVLAFFPKAHWLADAKLPKLFFGVCHLSTRVTPADLADRVRNGLHLMEEHAPEWLHPPAA
ncbi:MAG TPA: CvpA family protein [Terracidiphilus sp.]|nr:CvpA family protein [Terracidiphilus sp.]